MKVLGVMVAALLAGMGAQCSAQDSTPVPTSTATSTWSPADLDQMLGPIALYPDPLIGLILPAATVPSQIVLASRYVAGGGDPDQIAAQGWDPSVQGLAHYPTVLQWMDENLAWTTEIGEAFANQQPDVMDSIQRLRAKAESLGNLESTPQENVDTDNGIIDIDPTDENEVYVPDYDPGLIYSEPGVYCSFGIGFPIGVWLGYDWDWRHHRLLSWGRGHERPGGWWRLPPSRRGDGGAEPWQPRPPRERGGSVIIAGGNQRLQNRGFSSSFIAPRTPAPRPPERSQERNSVSVTTIGRPTESFRPTESIHPAESFRAPEISRPAERSEPSESAFGGAQSAREVRESSSRGTESRSFGGGGASRSEGSSSRR
jgi:hypothetical protein